MAIKSNHRASLGAKCGCIVLLGAVFVLAAMPYLASSDGNIERESASLRLPNLSATHDVDRILDEYPVYLQFIVEIGKTTDMATTKRIQHNYKVLKNKDKEFAARFLKGLRFEMVERLEIDGMSGVRLSTKSPQMVRWVSKYLKTWDRELDEALFRAQYRQIAKRQ